MSKDDVGFLGVDIRRNNSDEAKVVQRIVRGRPVKSRINNTRLYLYMPVEKILKRLNEAGFTKTYVSKNGVNKLVPNAITK